MGFYTMTFQITMRVGGLQAGLMTDWIGAPFALGIGALLSLFYGLFVFVRFKAVQDLK